MRGRVEPTSESSSSMAGLSVLEVNPRFRLFGYSCVPASVRIIVSSRTLVYVHFVPYRSR